MISVVVFNSATDRSLSVDVAFTKRGEAVQPSGNLLQFSMVYIYIYSPIIDYYSPNPYEFTREYMICGHVWVNNPRCNLVLHVAMIRKIIHLERLDGNHVFVPTTNQEHDNSMVIS